MEIESLLNEQLQKRFVANSAIEAIESNVKKMVTDFILKKYKHKRLLRNGLEFELIDVRTDFSHWQANSISISKIEIELAFFCMSKLPKNKKERVEKEKEYYLKNKRMHWNNFTIPLWHDLTYSFELKTFLEGNINLTIE